MVDSYRPWRPHISSLLVSYTRNQFVEIVKSTTNDRCKRTVEPPPNVRHELFNCVLKNDKCLSTNNLSSSPRAREVFETRKVKSRAILFLHSAIIIKDRITKYRYESLKIIDYYYAVFTMRTDERTVKYRRTLWKGRRSIHASVLPFATIRPVKTSSRRATMDLSTTPRRITEGVADLQKTRVAKSVFSIRSLVDVGDTDLSEVEDNEKIQSEFFTQRSFFLFPVLRKACWRGILSRPYTIVYVICNSLILVYDMEYDNSL